MLDATLKTNIGPIESVNWSASQHSDVKIKARRIWLPASSGMMVNVT